jgi:hypothetical protein
MKRISASFLPPIALAYRTKPPMYRQLYDWFRRAIIDGQMSTYYSKPPTRGGLILGYGGANTHQIHDGIRKLRMSVQGQIT